MLKSTFKVDHEAAPNLNIQGQNNNFVSFHMQSFAQIFLCYVLNMQVHYGLFS
jgi:hypothetical protein